MKKINIYMAVAALSAVTLSSCDLELLPNNAIAYVPGEAMYISEDDVTSAENGVLASYRSLNYGVYSQASEVMLDGFNATADFANNYGSMHRCDASFDASVYEPRDVWMYSYFAMKNFNIAYAAADNVDSKLSAKARILKGETAFCRAATYLNLARHFGNAYKASTASTDLSVPLIVVYNQNEKPVRATNQEVYDQIKKDLDTAAVILKSVAGSVRAQKPTIDAVNALYARYYLDIADYTNAAASAMSVINSSAEYKLANSADAMTAEYVNDKGTEPIMQMYASTTEGAGANSIYTLTGNDDKEGLYFGSYFIPTKKLIDAYDEGDLRFASWYTDEMPTRINGSFYTGEFYTFVKYYDNPSLRSGNVPTGAHARKPFLISEMYLIAAEAYAQSGNAQAKEVLNQLQTARGASLTDGTLAKVKEEWFKETVGEGLRISCIKRWGESLGARVPQAGALANNAVSVGADYIERSLSSTDYHLNWPIPTYEMKLSGPENGGNLIQNPGYEG